MGLEAQCRARLGNNVSEGKARLEEKNLTFRGDFRLSIPIKDIQSAEAKRGRLTVRFSRRVATFELGPRAEKWALKIRYPRSRLDKLGVKPAFRVAVLRLADKGFVRELSTRTKDIANGRLKRDSDVIFLGTDRAQDLSRIKSLEPYLKRNAALWVVWPKGQPHIKQSDVMAAAKRAGLVDVKIVAFSETHSALKLVIPLARR
jgi:hypothetical protein